MDLNINPLSGLKTGPLSESAELRVGQLFRGTVKKLFPGQTAEVVTGGRVLTARLEVPLKAGEAYLFQVTAADPQVQLKVTAGSRTSPAAALGLPDSKEARQLLELLISRNIPVKRDQLLQAVKALEHAQPGPKSLEAAAVLLERQLPVSPKILQSLATEQSGLSPDLKKLADLIRSGPSTPVLTELAESAERLVGPSQQTGSQFREVAESGGLPATSSDQVNGQTAREAIRTILRLLGANYEPQLLKGNQPEQEALKPQLVKLLQDSGIPPLIREQADKIVNKLNAQPLAASDGPQQVQQLLMHLPLQFGGRQLDALLEWNGRKRDDGQIDPDYARVVFYLDLPALKETVIDMAVQNRVVSLTVVHDDAELAGRIAPLEDSLKAGLASTDYRLSSVTVRPTAASEENQQERVYSPTGKGVDFRV